MDKVYIITKDSLADELEKCIRDITIDTIDQCLKVYEKTIDNNLSYANILNNMKYRFESKKLENIKIIKE